MPPLMANSIRETMFCRAKGKLPRRSVRPATFATAKKVPEESRKSSGGLAMLGRFLQVPLFFYGVLILAINVMYLRNISYISIYIH